MKKSFSLAVKKILATIGLMIVSSNGLQAASSISGVELRGHLTSYLAEQGLAGAPALNSTRQFRACSADSRNDCLCDVCYAIK